MNQITAWIIEHVIGKLPTNLQIYVIILLATLYGASDILPYIKFGPAWLQKADTVLIGKRSLIACILKGEGVDVSGGGNSGSGSTTGSSGAGTAGGPVGEVPFPRLS